MAICDLETKAMKPLINECMQDIIKLQCHEPVKLPMN